VQYSPLRKKFPIAAVAAIALLSVAACSSRNPDALIGMNVDENLAIMNADENVTSEAPANEQAVAPSAVSGETASAKPKQVATSDDEETNVAETDQIIQPDEPTTGNQSEENEDEPHAER
jgi:hypothetical protein